MGVRGCTTVAWEMLQGRAHTIFFVAAHSGSNILRVAKPVLSISAGINIARRPGHISNRSMVHPEAKPTQEICFFGSIGLYGINPLICQILRKWKFRRAEGRILADPGHFTAFLVHREQHRDFRMGLGSVGLVLYDIRGGPVEHRRKHKESTWMIVVDHGISLGNRTRTITRIMNKEQLAHFLFQGHIKHNVSGSDHLIFGPHRILDRSLNNKALLVARGGPVGQFKAAV